jgi:hypothetical protein
MIALIKSREIGCPCSRKILCRSVILHVVRLIPCTDGGEWSSGVCPSCGGPLVVKWPLERAREKTCRPAKGAEINQSVAWLLA